MAEVIEAQAFAAKARENLASAAAELRDARYNACANRCYYACFQAAIAALLRAGIAPIGPWGHAFVQAQFTEQLIRRRKLMPDQTRSTLVRLMDVRHRADYAPVMVSQTQAARALRLAEQFVGHALGEQR